MPDQRRSRGHAQRRGTPYTAAALAQISAGAAFSVDGWNDGQHQNRESLQQASAEQADAAP